MAILPMKKIHLVALNRDRKNILEFLQRRGVVEVSTPEALGEDTVFSQHECSDIVSAIAEKSVHVQQALGILEEHTPDVSSFFDMFQGLEELSLDDYYETQESEDRVYALACEIQGLNTKVSHLEAELLRLKSQKEELVPWQGLKVPLNYNGTPHTSAFVGSVPGALTKKELLIELAKADPDLAAVHIEVISSNEEQTSLLVLGLHEERHELKAALDLLDFRFPQLQSKDVPKDMLRALTQREATAKEEIKDIYREIGKYTHEKQPLRLLGDYFAIQIENQQTCSHLLESRHTFLLEGYLPEKETHTLEALLQKNYASLVSFSDAKEDAPVVFDNNWFSEPTESVVSSYSYPGPGEIDPTGVMSIFYYIMFGLMFSDAGYGLILAGVCGILLLKFKNMSVSMNKNLRMFFWCGISTIFWGIVFSSYFGNIVEAISSTYTNHTWNIPPLWFDPMQKPMLLLVFCMGIGVVHLSTGYIMNAVTSVKNKDYPAILFDAGFPLIFIAGILAIFVGTDMFENLSGFRVVFPPLILAISKWAAIAACIGTVIFAGRDSKNWGTRIAFGLYELYNMLAGWLSDILSYSRLLALGLATGIIGTVINTLGTMGGRGFTGVLMFLLVFVFGHALNFGINILGAYVHSNRLEYVEFFGKFYDGGGRKFSPFGMHTNHYKFREETKND